MGLEIISDDHLHVHVVKELIQIFKLWFFRVAIFDFSKGLTQDHSQTVSSNLPVSVSVCQPPDRRVSIQPANYSAIPSANLKY